MMFTVPRSPWRCWCARALARGIDLSVSECERITGWILEQPGDPLAARAAAYLHPALCAQNRWRLHRDAVAAHLRGRPWLPDVCGLCGRPGRCRRIGSAGPHRRSRPRVWCASCHVHWYEP